MWCESFPFFALIANLYFFKHSSFDIFPNNSLTKGYLGLRPTKDTCTAGYKHTGDDDSANLPKKKLIIILGKFALSSSPVCF